MVDLLLSILFSSILFIVFKSFSRFNIDTFQAIVFNYLVAFSVGIINSSETISLSKTIEKPWILSCLYLGVLFISVFFVIGKTSQKNGVTVASVASKMSLILPILFGILYFKEEVSSIKIAGIIIAIVAVYFTTKKEKNSIKASNFIFPILVFLGSGTIDTSMNFIQNKWVNGYEIPLFSSITFLCAFLIGFVFIVFQFMRNKFQYHSKNLLGGILLGIPNYFSLYFLIHALQNKELQSSIVFTLINIGVILLTTLFGILLFKEVLKKHNYIGIVLAIIALFLVTY